MNVDKMKSQIVRPPTLSNAIESRELRNTLSKFGTGVVVLTTQSSDGPIGMTINSFSSVSLDPPLVLWSLAKAARRTPYFINASSIAIHVLSQAQEALCWSFAKSENPFDEVQWQMSDENTPHIAGCLARFEVKLEACYAGGDHEIMLARVASIESNVGEPLIFFGGKIRELAKHS